MVENIEAKGGEISDCTHHWIIEPQGVSTSPGKCKKCNLTRDDFANSLELAIEGTIKSGKVLSRYDSFGGGRLLPTPDSDI